MQQSKTWHCFASSVLVLVGQKKTSKEKCGQIIVVVTCQNSEKKKDKWNFSFLWLCQKPIVVYNILS